MYIHTHTHMHTHIFIHRVDTSARHGSGHLQSWSPAATK